MMPKGNKLLIVDDMEANRALLKGYAQHIGMTPMVAANGLSALISARKDPPDLVLLDLMMPEMDGQEVLRRLKSEGSLRDIPVIILSAATDMERIVQCIEQGALDYLTKPFNLKLLKARIDTALQLKAARDAEKSYQARIEA